MAYDLVVRGGTIVDGSGLPRYRADVGVDGGTIAAIGRIGERGAEEIDAEGHVVTPGFIDGHTHMDAQIFWDPLGTCSCWHGVTTVVMGNCGFTLAPAPRRRARPGRAQPRARRGHLRRRRWPPASSGRGRPSAEYLDAVDGLPKGINYAAYIGHSALRTWVMGERAFEEAATATTSRRWSASCATRLRAGAIGFTTSRSTQPRDPDDRPVASRLAAWDEVEQLVGAMGELGAGVFELAHEPQARRAIPRRGRGPTAGCAGWPSTPACRSPSACWRGRPADLARPARPHRRRPPSGGRMFGQTHSRGISVLLSFKTRLPFDQLPEWREVRALPLDEQAELLRDPEVREPAWSSAAHEGDYGRAVGAEARKPDYDRIRVLERPVPPNPTVAELAERRRSDPVELMIDLALESNFEHVLPAVRR